MLITCVLIVINTFANTLFVVNYLNQASTRYLTAKDAAVAAAAALGQPPLPFPDY